MQTYAYLILFALYLGVKGLQLHSNTLLTNETKQMQKLVLDGIS